MHKSLWNDFDILNVVLQQFQTTNNGITFNHQKAWFFYEVEFEMGASFGSALAINWT